MATYQTGQIYVTQADAVMVKCPYCGFENHFSLPVRQPQVVTCDSEEGGCDRYFVAKITVTATVTTMAVVETDDQ